MRVVDAYFFLTEGRHDGDDTIQLGDGGMKAQSYIFMIARVTRGVSHMRCHCTSTLT